MVDPYDPMRGRYVQLNPVPNTWNSKQKEVFSYNQSGYAVIKKNSDGFAEIVRLEQNRTELKPGEMAVKVTGIVSTQEDNTFSVYRFNWPFKRFYLNELKAPELEKELQKQDNSLDLKVKIFGDGSFAVIGLEKQ